MPLVRFFDPCYRQKQQFVLSVLFLVIFKYFSIKLSFCFKNTDHLNSQGLQCLLKFCIQFTPDASLTPGIANNRPVQKCSLGDPRRALVKGAFWECYLKFLSPRIFLVQMTF
jgi:hypothetical protein